MNVVFKTRNFVVKTRNCVSKTMNFALKMMNSAAAVDDSVSDLMFSGSMDRIDQMAEPVDAAGKLFRHPSAVGGNEFPEGNMQATPSPKAHTGKMGQLMRVWRQLDEKWFKPWFGGLPRTPTALEQRHKVLITELGRAEAKLREEQLAAVSTEELVTGAKFYRFSTGSATDLGLFLTRRAESGGLGHSEADQLGGEESTDRAVLFTSKMTVFSFLVFPFIFFIFFVFRFSFDFCVGKMMTVL